MTMEKRIRRYTVLVNEDGMRLDEFLAYKIARLSRSQANTCIKSGAVSVEPYRPAKPSLKLHTDDVVALSQTMSGDEPMYDEVAILDETEDFWVFHKPAGMAVHPTANIYHNTLTRFVETQLGCKGFVVHRLDKETSGVLLMAKTPEAGRALDGLFPSRSVQKTYDAVVCHTSGKYYPGMRFDVDIPLGFAGIVLPRITMGVGDLPAHTTFECTATRGDFAWLRADLHSGRQHQIRVHLALHGTPILGDKLYLFGERFYKDYLDGKDVPMYSPPRHLLHASDLSFEWKGRQYSWHDPVPELMQAVFRGPMLDSMFPTDYAALFAS